MSLSIEKTLDRAAEILAGSRSVLFITGAGISADSGLPTYRGIGGLYNGRLTEEGISIEAALTGETLLHHPEVTWKYLAQIEEKCRHAQFNRAHEVIARLEARMDRLWVLTQNIDGFHQAAGSRHVIDIHGDMHRLLCLACGWRRTIGDFSGLQIPPLCPFCGRVVRPDVVLFGEFLPEEKLGIFHGELKKGFDAYVSVGTTSIFPYIQRPMVDARRHGKPTIEINPGETEISEIVDVKISLGAAEALHALQGLLEKRQK
ncbi:MAG: NAD-dependent protein deacylase [Candidatus Omnitrophica bacterium]|nr:NAD-dependent protein deacylase [Candidatus Omnitrophota bacterium]MDD5573604.1 NAD-dependent protein deacylase [Candidatus Omnitrophota bacterium]